MSKKFKTVNVHSDVHEMLRFIAETQNISMNKCLEDLLKPITQLLASFKANTVSMRSYVRVIPSEVILEFYGKRTLKWGTEDTVDIMSSKLEKVLEQ